LVKVLADATISDFALLTSAMHMSWLRLVGGRLESRYRYTIGVVYNTFPLPPVSKSRLAQLGRHAQRVLDARAEHPDASLADLYDPDFMPPALRKAHQALDKAVDRLYRKSGFTSDSERAGHLLRLYEKLVNPCLAQSGKKARPSASARRNYGSGWRLHQAACVPTGTQIAAGRAMKSGG